MQKVKENNKLAMKLHFKSCLSQWLLSKLYLNQSTYYVCYINEKHLYKPFNANCMHKKVHMYIKC